jgi:drug/metabolite transporter (DMT)-like permease
MSLDAGRDSSRPRPTRRRAVVCAVTGDGRAAADALGRHALGTGLVVLSAAAFGLITTSSRVAYTGGAAPSTIVLLRFIAFVAVVGAVLLLRRRGLGLPREGLLASLWLAVTTMIMSVGYLSSVAFIPVTLAAIVFYTFPLLVGLGSTLMRRERMTRTTAAALTAAFAGLTLAIGPSFAGLDWRGIACAFAAATGVACTILFGGPALRRHDGLAMNFYINLWQLLAVSAFVLTVGGVPWPATLAGEIGAGAATALYVVAFLSWFAAMPLIPPVRVAALFNLEPVVSIIAAATLLGERLSGLQLVGVALVLAALLALALAGRRREAAVS